MAGTTRGKGRLKRGAPRARPTAPSTALAPLAKAARPELSPGLSSPEQPAGQSAGQPTGKARRPGAVRRVVGVVRRHPVATVVTALAAGALVTWAVRSRHRWRPLLRQAASLRMPDLGPIIAPLIRDLTPQLKPMVRRVGVAGMKFKADLPGGSHRTFGVRWKRRPADAQEDSWFTDEVELGTRRADGGRSDFELTWKTVPAGEVIDDAPRYPGDSALGETSLELETKRPDGRKTGMGFTWRKLPPKVRSSGGTPEREG
jgi:hypothetical protein